MNNNKLEELREINDLTCRDVANILDVSDSVYSRWEKGKDIIPTKRLYQLANYYQVNIDYIIGLTNTKIKIISNDKIDMNLISNRIREIRNDYNESLRQFVLRLYTSNSTWSAYETGKALILCAFLIQVCKFGNYSADWILGRTDKKKR